MLRVCVWLNAKKRKQWLPTVFPHTAYRCHSCQCGTHHHHSRPHQSQRESNIPDGQQQHQLECSAADRDADADGSTDRYVNVEILPIETVEEFEQKGPFDVLLLKVTDLLSRAVAAASASSYSDANSAAMQTSPPDASRSSIADLSPLLSLSPSLIHEAEPILAIRRIAAAIDAASARDPLSVIDPLRSVLPLMDRATMQTTIQMIMGQTMQDDDAKQKYAMNQVDGKSRSQMQAPCKTKPKGFCKLPPAFLYQESETMAGVDVRHDNGHSIPGGAQSDATTSSSSLITSSQSPPLPLFHHHLPPSVPFPVICKRVSACGTPHSHHMYIIHNELQMAWMRKHASESELKKQNQEKAADAVVGVAQTHSTSFQQHESAAAATVWLVQQYVNHGAVLYKVYVLDEEVTVVPKPSLPNITVDSPPYYVDSQTMQLYELRPDGSVTPAPLNHAQPPPPPTSVPAAVRHVAEQCASQLRRQLQLRLFGFDIIQQDSTQVTKESEAHNQVASALSTGLDEPTFFLVDMNYFPSYKSIPDLTLRFLSLCVRYAPQSHPSLSTPPAPPSSTPASSSSSLS